MSQYVRAVRAVIYPAFLLMAFIAGGTQSAQAREIIAESYLTAATVYTNRATVTREAVIDVPAGASAAVFRGLPPGLMPDSLRAEGESAAPVIFGALTHRLRPQSELSAPREQELTAQLETLEDRKKVIEAERAALAVQHKFLETLGQQAGERSGEQIAELRLNSGQWQQAASDLGQGVEEILKADLAHGTALRALDQEIRKIRDELAQLRTGQRRSYEITIPLESAQDTRLTIRLSYQLPNVSWRPVYDARLDTESGALELVQYGSVRQNTGEDWDDVRLTLSTAQPHRGAGLPDLPPHWVDLYDPSAPRLSREMAADSMVMSRAAAPAMEYMAQADDKAAGFAEAEINTGGFVTEYNIPGQANVKADGSESKVMIGRFDTENKMQIQIKPQISTDAYLISRATLQGDVPLLPGTASLFRDGSYVGQMALPLLRPGQAQDIGFGIDDQIAVTRSIIQDERSDATFLSRDNSQERHFATVIENSRAQNVELVVLETIPAPRHDRIKMEILSGQTTAGYERDIDDTPGLLRWTLPLAGGGQQRVTLGWKVSWPRDQAVSGL